MELKVLLINGSQHKTGCTHTALGVISEELNRLKITTEEFWVGNKAIMGCHGCGRCKESLHCWNNDDSVNDFLKIAPDFDGYIFGSPVHFAGASGFIKPFMDRAFCSKASMYFNKPAAAIVSCRRGGALGGWDDMNRYFTISNMPVVASQYWNEIHGNTPEEVLQDAEGLQIMQQLARNLAWLLRCIAAGRQAGIPLPEHEPTVKTNFIR